MIARRFGLMAAVGLGWLAAASGAWAAKSCVGTSSGNLITPLPHPAVIRVHVSDGSAANLALAERFRAGLVAGGAKLSDTGGLGMELAASITGGPDAAHGAGSVSPEFGLVGRLPPGGEPPVLTMSISVMNTEAAEIDWVGYISCKVMTPDLGIVIQDLGLSIGRSIGQTFSTKPL